MTRESGRSKTIILLNRINLELNTTKRAMMWTVIFHQITSFGNLSNLKMQHQRLIRGPSPDIKEEVSTETITIRTSCRLWCPETIATRSSIVNWSSRLLKKVRILWISLLATLTNTIKTPCFCLPITRVCNTLTKHNYLILSRDAQYNTPTI